MVFIFIVLGLAAATLLPSMLTDWIENRRQRKNYADYQKTRIKHDEKKE